MTGKFERRTFTLSFQVVFASQCDVTAMCKRTGGLWVVIPYRDFKLSDRENANIWYRSTWVVINVFKGRQLQASIENTNAMPAYEL